MSKPPAHSLPHGPARLLPLIVLVLVALLGPSSAFAAGPSEEETAAAPGAAGEEAPAPAPPTVEIPIVQVEVALPPPPTVELPPVPVVEQVVEPIIQVVEPVSAPAAAEEHETPAAVVLKDEKAAEGAAEGPATQTSGEDTQALGRQTPQSPAPIGQALMPAPGSAAPATALSTGAVLVAAKSRSAAAKLRRQTTCALSSLGAAMTEDCVRGESGGWLVAQTPSPSFPPSGPLAAIGARSGARHAKDRGPENRLSIPPPGPAPSGGDEGPAAGGAGSSAGAAVAAVALLLLSVPYVTRRLRILRRSWRTSFFVLIPERPG